MGRIIRYEVLEPHLCPDCGKVYGQISKSAAWIGRAFPDCDRCHAEAAKLLIDAYRDGLKVTFTERSTQ
jgi:ssDNA-binding Zn-finger/Zn-ribbon topoisomerase 1